MLLRIPTRFAFGSAWRERQKHRGIGRWGLALLVGVVFSGCATPPRSGPPIEPVYPTAEARAEAQTAVLEQVWELVQDRFYAQDYNGADWATALDRYRSDAAAAVDAAALHDVINTMLAELGDAHTYSMSPQESWELYVAERAYVGINLERIDEHWVVAELRPGGAAEEAGVQPGWVAIARDGQPLPEDGITFHNEAGVGYTWTFVDAENQLHEIVLAARTLADRMPPVERHSNEGWVYLRFDEFEADYHEWLRERIEVHRDAPGIVLDLRQNIGGAVWSLEEVINDVFPARVAYGTFVSRRGRRAAEKSALWGGAHYAGALVVLIGPGSASSAEIFAHTLKHYERATLVGRPTAGVVVASQTYRLRDGGELQLGTYDFQGLDGDRLEGRGVAPDVVVERTLDDLRAGRDPDLAVAVECLRAAVAQENVPSLSRQ